MRVEIILAIAAMSLAVLAVAGGDFDRPTAYPRQHQVDVFAVARSLRDREPVQILDLRPKAEFDTFHLPRALPASELDAVLASDANIPVVLYGYEENDQWMRLKERGFELRFLPDGATAWLSDILNPVIYQHAPASDRLAFEQHSDLSRYFGGAPRVSLTPILSERPAGTLRKGCGF